MAGIAGVTIMPRGSREMTGRTKELVKIINELFFPPTESTKGRRQLYPETRFAKGAGSWPRSKMSMSALRYLCWAWP